jgi:hypothetical protein
VNPLNELRFPVNRLNIFLLFFCSLFCITLAQTSQHELLQNSWYHQGFPGADSIRLSRENNNALSGQLKFSTNGKLIFYSSKKDKPDSSYRFDIGKKKISFQFDSKDSVKTYEYSLKENRKKGLYRLHLIYSFVYKKRAGDDTIVVRELGLKKGNDTKTIDYLEDLTVFGQKRGLKGDSVDFAVWGQFVGFKKDTILIDCDQFIKHNFYKKYPDSMHYYAPLLMDTVIRIKLPIKEIDRIYKEREPFSTYMTRATVSGIGLGLVCMVGSLVSGETDASTVFAQVATVSFLTVPVSFGIGFSFSKQKFWLHDKNKSTRLWKIERHLPGAQIKAHAKQKKS